MKSKLIILVIIALCCSISVMAKTLDVIHLKNGSIIRGTIIESVPNESFTIKSNSNIFVYQVKDIAKITREEEEFYDFCPEIGCLTNVNETDYINANVIKANLNNLWNISSNAAIGGGIGIGYYFESVSYTYLNKTYTFEGESSLFSIYAAAKFKPSSTVPIFIETKLGYSFTTKNSIEGFGALFNFGGGYDFDRINLSLRYEYQDFDYSADGYHLVGLIIGFTF